MSTDESKKQHDRFCQGHSGNKGHWCPRWDGEYVCIDCPEYGPDCEQHFTNNCEECANPCHGVSPPDVDCDHVYPLPSFDEDAARGMDPYEVRKRWPRYSGPCPNCGQPIVSYASIAHYVAGDW